MILFKVGDGRMEQNLYYDTINRLKERIQNHKNKLLEKEQMENEKNQWKKMYEELKSIREEKEKLYNNSTTEKNKQELDSWLQEENAYIKLLNQYTIDINKINEELDVYSDEDYRREFALVSASVEFEDISRRMKEIENQSKKKLSKIEKDLERDLLSMKFEDYGKICLSAEGRKKKILNEYVEEYKKLSERKYELSKTVKDGYNLIINGYYDEKIIGKEKSSNLEDVEFEKISIEKINDTETFDLNDDEVIEKLEKRKEEIKKSSGRKMTFTCYGEKVTVPRRLRSEYENCCRKIRDLKEKNVVKTESSKKEVIAVGKIEKDKNTSEILRQRLIDLYRENEESLKEYEFEQQNTKEKQEVGIIPSFKEDFNSTKPKGIVKYNDELDEDYIMPITWRKSKNKARLKEKLKKSITVIVASIICTVSELGVSKLVKKDKKDIVEPKVDNIVSNTIEETTDIEEATKTIENKIKEDIRENTANQNITINDNEEKVTNEQFTEYALDNQFKVEENSEIYSDLYKASSKTDGQKMYYSVDDLRTIDGLGIEYNGNMLSFIEVAGDENLYIVKGLGDNLYLTKDEANSKIKELIDNGAVVKSVLSKDKTGDYEGFFSADNIEVGGIHR